MESSKARTSASEVVSGSSQSENMSGGMMSVMRSWMWPSASEAASCRYVGIFPPLPRHRLILAELRSKFNGTVSVGATL
jgi:hypothetical protein